jgi:hypothetical protein
VWKITILRQKIIFFPIFLLISWILLSDIAYYRTVVTYTKRVNSFLVQVKYDFTKGGGSCQKCIYRTINVMETAYSILKKRYITNGSLYAYYNVHIRCRIRDLSSLLSVNSVCRRFLLGTWHSLIVLSCACLSYSKVNFTYRTYVRKMVNSKMENTAHVWFQILIGKINMHTLLTLNKEDKSLIRHLMWTL